MSNQIAKLEEQNFLTQMAIIINKNAAALLEASSFLHKSGHISLALLIYDAWGDLDQAVKLIMQQTQIRKGP